MQSVCVSKGLDLHAAVSLQCVYVGMLWATLRGAWSHSANGAAGTASESIRPRYSSCSATVLSVFPPLLLSLPAHNLPFPSSATRSRSQPRVACKLPRSPRRNIHHTPRERGHHSWQLSHWLTWHSCWLRRQGKHFWRGRHGWVWECSL